MSYVQITKSTPNQGNKGGSYTMITKEKEIENDRDRISKKFNFISNKILDHNTNSINKSTISEQTASIKQAQHNTRNKTSNPLNEAKTNTNTKQMNSATKDMTKKTNVSMQIVNTQQSDETEKESKCRLYRINHTINYQNSDANDNESLNELNSVRQINDNTMPLNENYHQGKCGNEDNDNDNDNDEDCLEEESSESSSESINPHNKNNCATMGIKRFNFNSSSCSNNNNNYTNPHNHNHKYNNLQAKNRKMKQLFISNPLYNISTRLLNDEVHSYNKRLIDNKEYRFMREVKHVNDQLRKIKIGSFIKLSDCSIYNILSFCYDNYDNIVLNKNKLLSTKISICFNNMFDKVIETFQSKYSNILHLEAFYFKQKTFKHLKHSYPILDLVIKVKVISKAINKSYEIGYSYSSNENIVFDQKWKFDIKSNGSDHLIWFASEFDLYNHNMSRFCYAQPVSSFIPHDIIELRMTVFSLKSIINPFSIQWEDLIINDSPSGFYQKSILKSPYDFDPLYACEIENMIHQWKAIKTIKHQYFERDVRRYFSKHFEIEKIVYDSSTWIFYKFEMKAVSEGRIKRNHYINFDIEILKKGDVVKNEIQALGLLNSTLLMDCIQIRKGTVIVFYFTDLLSD